MRIERGTIVKSQRELRRLLERWYRETDEEMIGGDPRFKRTPWVFLEFDGLPGLAQLNADTKRTAVAEYLRESRSGDLEWHVVESQRRNPTKVVYASGAKRPGWYCYLVGR